MSKTSIVATIGPVSNNAQALKSLRDAGMTVARLNGSHNSLEWHAATIKLLRETVPGVPVLLDIPGRKIRTTQLRVEPSFQAGEIVVLTTDTSHDGSIKVPVNYDVFHEKLRAGVRVFADDGTLSFIVDKVDGRDVHLRAEAAGTLKSRKGINVPEIDLGQRLVTQRDHDMIAFAREHGVDFVGISFVESAAHVDAIRGLIAGASPQIVAKVENQGGLDHLEEITAAADVIMIDRGDLSVETSVDHVSLYQKRIVAAAREHGKPVIVATELLHSMIENPLPTKAEISDVTNAVIDGATAVMLSGETAVGKFPVAAVARLRSIVTLAEAHHQIRASSAALPADLRAATQALARTLPISKVVVLSRSGYAARLVAMAGIAQPVLAVGNDEALTRSWNLLPGTTGIHLPWLAVNSESATTVAVKALWEQGLVQDEDIVLVAQAASDHGLSSLNHLHTLQVGRLVAEQGWSPAHAATGV